MATLFSLFSVLLSPQVITIVRQAVLHTFYRLLSSCLLQVVQSKNIHLTQFNSGYLLLKYPSRHMLLYLKYCKKEFLRCKEIPA